MLLETAIVIGVGSAVLLATTIFSKLVLGRGGLTLFALQQVAMSLAAGYLFSAGMIGLVSLGILVAVPVMMRVFALLILWGMGIRALRGGYGEETRWAAELFKENDREFITAVQGLPKTEKKELAIIAENKEGLRELTVQRYEELRDE